MEVNNLIVNGNAKFINNIEIFEENLINDSYINYTSGTTISYLKEIPDCKYITFKLFRQYQSDIKIFLSIMKIPINEWKNGDIFVLYCRGDSSFQDPYVTIKHNTNSLIYTCSRNFPYMNRPIYLSATINYI